MPILSCTNLRHAFGTRTILDGVSLSIEPGERLGIVGRNGCGKSTLLKVLSGVVEPQDGEVSLARGSRAGYLEQDPTFDPDETLRGAAEAAFAELHRLHHDLNVVFERMGTAEGADLERLLKKQAELERQIDAAGGYAIDHKIDAVLHGLGFTDAQFTVPVPGLSGGQRGRLALARLLLENPDALLLDEPTNHLDIEGCLWLESFLKEEFRGAVVMVSHDRYLLDNVVTRIIEVEQGRLIDYPGNYEAFREIRAQRRLTMLRAYENEQDKFRKEEAFIRRYRAGQRAKQAQGRLSKLTRAKEQSTLERPMEMDAFRLELPRAERTGDIVISARGLSKSYTQEDGSVRVLFKDLDVSIGRGERWGIIGPNGAGKSTLVRCLLKEQEPDAGTVRIGSNVKVGHYKQIHDFLDPEISVYRYLQGVILKECPGQLLSEQQARDLAGAFLFSGSEQEREMGRLSGGERSRAVLAGLLASAKNLLVLDEPTNHLDIPSAERLEDALAPPDEETGESGYEGCLILISHDRALIDATCDHLLVMDGRGNVEVFHGNYSLWHEKDLVRRAEALAAQRKEQERQVRVADQAKARQKPAPSASGGAGAKNPLARLSIEEIEGRIAKIEARIAEIDRLMGEPEVWGNPARCQSLGQERTNLVQELEPLEMEYFGRSG
ncbi:MAG: ATP-binding cassette domain-containing protein [Phycisphaeraceae bacterium]|nr:ATP-binding cassette domain-containing protein [Phycisphaeraceae bacterium]